MFGGLSGNLKLRLCQQEKCRYRKAFDGRGHLDCQSDLHWRFVITAECRCRP